MEDLIYIHIHIHIYTFIHTYIHTYTHTHTHTRAGDGDGGLNLHTYTYTYIYFHTYIHTHTHTHTHVQVMEMEDLIFGAGLTRLQVRCTYVYVFECCVCDDVCMYVHMRYMFCGTSFYGAACQLISDWHMYVYVYGACVYRYRSCVCLYVPRV